MRVRSHWTMAVFGAAVVGLGAVATGSLPGPGGATARAQEADADLGYTCAFPSGTSQRFGVRVRGTFPASGTVGQPVRPGRVTAAVTIPKAALPEVTGLGGASVVGTAQLGTSVTQNGKSAPVSWDGLTTPSTPVADGADLVLAASGDVPPVTPAGTGDLTFAAGALTLTLSPRAANGTTSGAATGPATGQANGTADGGTTGGGTTGSGAAGGAGGAPKTLRITCEPVAGQTLTLATVPVTGASGSPAPEASAAPKPGARAAAPAGTPPECGSYPPPSDDWMPGCVYLSGFANVAKLKGASVLNDPEFAEPVLTTMVYALTPDGNGAMVRQRFVRPLRSRSTFLTFGFMPTTATMEMTQRPLDPGNPSDPKDYGTYDAVSGADGFQTVTAHMRMSIRIYDVRVNGTPMDVGGRCRTRTDADITLKGRLPNVLEAGMVEGEFTIPPFAGCGVGEDLDPLFSGSVAGPGNLIRVSLGASCIPDVEINCPPVLPEPRRSAAPPG
ncbi:DUF6801 domain-containing protein [Actinomadura fibrosa]|uniref:DUF6801 domain-containing protein n=1 Tax=Actinomadura fibrosa TaxID=111802 RepID=A0ABW2XDZ1_9ACTN|nr:DUF6801 domain-containing protein [Actinomadura fibrosa]